MPKEHFRRPETVELWRRRRRERIRLRWESAVVAGLHHHRCMLIAPERMRSNRGLTEAYPGGDSSAAPRPSRLGKSVWYSFASLQRSTISGHAGIQEQSSVRGDECGVHGTVVCRGGANEERAGLAQPRLELVPVVQRRSRVRCDTQPALRCAQSLAECERGEGVPAIVVIGTGQTWARPRKKTRREWWYGRGLPVWAGALTRRRGGS